jgi:hypothetical protein
MRLPAPNPSPRPRAASGERRRGVEQPASIGQDRRTCLGQLRAVVPPHEQRHAELALDLKDRRFTGKH